MAAARGASDDSRVGLWLAVIYVMIVVMVAVGGITRLTESGLSIVEWRPVTGVLPPLSEAAWQAEFARYQASPQFQQVNHWMALHDFQRIFFWEYLHRLLGRVLGLVVLVPWLVFAARGLLRGRWLWQTGTILALGACQGAMGWFMVKSGLGDVPSVSHFRLAAHLLLAFGTAQWVLWLILRWRAASRPPVAHVAMGRRWWTLLGGTSVVLVVQITYGAFVAGTRAGLLFPTFPDLNGAYAPGPFFTAPRDAVVSPIAIHYVHRALAFFLLAPVGALVAASLAAPVRVRRAAGWVAGLLVWQIALGALTVVWRVPISLAVAHQCTGLLLLSSVVALAFEANCVERGSDRAVR